MLEKVEVLLFEPQDWVHGELNDMISATRSIHTVTRTFNTNIYVLHSRTHTNLLRKPRVVNCSFTLFTYFCGRALGDIRANQASSTPRKITH
jgi:hypothetical protein